MSEGGGLPPGLAAPAVRALEAAGYRTLDDIATATEAELRGLHGMGPKAMALLREALAQRGHPLPPAATPPR